MFRYAFRFFTIRKNGIKETVIMKLNVQGHLKCTAAFGETTMSRKQIQMRYDRYREGRDRTCTSTTDVLIKAVQKMILDNRRITIRQVVADVSISF